MKVSTQRIIKLINVTKIYEWLKIISITAAAQVFVQMLGFLSSILIIRLLPSKEYALYTIANSILGTMILLSDSGISTGVLAQGGKVWGNKYQLGVILSTGLHIRKKFAFVTILIMVPVLGFLLIRNGASVIATVLITGSLIPAFYSSVLDGILEIIPKLDQVVLPLQKNQINVSINRLILTVSTLFFFPFTFIAILASGLPRIYGNFKLKKIVYRLVDENKTLDKKVERELIYIFKRFLPGVIYYCLSGQLMIFLISLLGNTKSIAEIGALSRISMPLSLITVVFSTLIIPRYSRLKEDRKNLLGKFLQILLLIVGMSLLIILITKFFATQFLLVLGKRYYHLELELFLCMIGGCLNMIVGVVLGTNTGRGWILHPFISITLEIAALVIGLYFFDISTLKGILILNIFIGLVQILISVLYGLVKIMKVKSLDLSIQQ